jgi:argininosuccinate synthase
MKVVVLYSGGLDTSVLLSWIKETYNCEVIAFCANVGQEEELDGLEEKAKKTGASEVRNLDLRDEFAESFIFPMMQADAIYEGQYLLGTSIARPIIVKHAVKIAREIGADAIAHGATGRGNDQVRFELGANALEPDLKVIAPWRDERFRVKFPGRKEMIEYCEKMSIPVQATAKKPYSSDRNLLHISFEAGILEDPWFDAFAPENKDMFKLSVSPEDAPNEPEYVTLKFHRGNCVGVDDMAGCSPCCVMQTLNRLGGKHGIGRVDMVENRFVGMKSRGVYETPGGTIIQFAHRQIESLTMDRGVIHLRDSLIPRYAELVYNGFWFSPERLALQAIITESQKNVSGVVRVKLYKGNVMVAGRRSLVSLYNPAIATMEDDPTKSYNQDDSTGFIRIQGVPLRVDAKVHPHQYE